MVKWIGYLDAIRDFAIILHCDGTFCSLILSQLE